jgi:ribosomal protein S18 acetylase RimI-like enzyme
MSDLHLEIRPARTPEDYPAIAEIHNLTLPWHMTAEDFARGDENADPKYHRSRFVAQVLEDRGLEGLTRRVVGAAMVRHDDFAHEDGKFIVSIMVHPDYQAKGIGGTLWETAQKHFTALGARKLSHMVMSDSERGVRMLGHLGFQQVWERIESRLDPRSVGFEAYRALDAALEARGIAVCTLESIGDADKLRKLYDLDKALMQDVPFGTPVTFPEFEYWLKDVTSDPKFDPQTVWVALDGDEWIALSSLEEQPDHFVIGMTGVKPAYRGLGVAKRLKLEGVRHALSRGWEIRTLNDHTNTAMLRMNEQMGFKRHRSMLRFEKLL